MIWWQWIALGTFILAAEMFVDAEFYLIFIGISAALVGLVGLVAPGLPIWGQWLLFAALAVFTLVLFRGPFYQKLRGSAPDLLEGVEGQSVVTSSALAAGGRGKVQLRGASWTAVNVGSEEIAANGRAVVVRASGLTLEVRAEA